MKVVIQDIPVMFVASPNGPASASDAFKKLEGALNWQLQGRKFYGTMFLGEYRACAAVTPKDDPGKLGLMTWIIPGGKYFKDKIADWEKHIPEIGPKCEEIIAKVQFDDGRPIIEFYRSQKELFLFVPVK